MIYQKRGSAPTNTIKLTFDFDTLDRLRARAADRKTDLTRCAYELLQEALGMRATVSAAPPPPQTPELEDRVGLLLNRINQQSRGRA